MRLCLLILLCCWNIPVWAGQRFNPNTNKPDFCVTVRETDLSPAATACQVLNVTNETLTDNGDGTFTLTTGGGGGDSITVNATAATDANFLDNLYIDWSINTAATPDDITAKLDYTQTLAGNPAFAAGEVALTTSGTTGGVLFEGAADTIEGLLQWAPTTADRTVTIQDSTHTLVGRDTTDTLTNKTIDATNTVTIDATDINAATSATWAGRVSDETGTGVWVFGTSPTITTSLTQDGDAADAGYLRLQNAANIAWEASPAGTDETLTLNASEEFVFSNDLLVSTVGPNISLLPTGGNTIHFGAEVAAGNTLAFISNATTGTHWLRFFGTDVQLPTLTNCNFLKTTPDGRLACPGAFSAGSIIFAGSSGGLIEDNANLFWDDTNNLLGIGTSTPNATLHLAGTQTTGVTYFSMLGTLQSSGSGQHNAFLNQATLDLQATPGPISAAYGLINLPIIASSLNDPDVTVVYGAFSRIDTNANYAGTIVNGRTFGAGNPATSGTNEITNFDQYYTDTITNGNGITSGTIQNRNLLANGSTAAAGLGGTITNYSLHVAVPSGSGAGTTTNQGLRITGNGGSGGSGTTTNWAIFSNSTANAALIGNLRLGSTVAPTALLHLDSADTTGATTEDVQFSSDAQTIALADGTTLGNQRQNQFIAPTINGVAAGGTETVTNAATVYINAAPSGSNITITNPYALWVDAGDVRSDGDLLLTGSAGPDIRWTPTNGDTLHLGAEVAAGNTLLFLSNVTTGTHWMRFFGTTIQLPNLTGCNKVITTADGRLACGDTIQTICGRIFNVASTDDNINIFMWNAAVTVTEVGCHCEGTCTTTATFALENRAGTAMTHTTPTCSTGATSSVFRPVTAGGNLVAGQGLRYDTTNTPSPDGSDEYLLCTTVKL